MYQHDTEARNERRRPDGPVRITPEVRARHALDRVEQVLSGVAEGQLDRPRLRAALQAPLADAELEQQRRFALGWLAWLDGDPAAAKPWLSGCIGARAAYWLGRVRLLLGEMDGLSAFEQQMRTFQGSPQATCWFVDLLWRAGRHERAAQVWKSVRLNKRVTACEEAALLEARALLAQDEAAAEKGLRESAPRNSVLQVERLLLLAWLMAGRQKREEAADLVEQASAFPYPNAALNAWEKMVRREDTLPFNALEKLPFSPRVQAWIQAQQARLPGGDPSRIPALLEIAAAVPRLQPFVRYVRACLGQDDFAALLGALPGAFLAARCRVWAVLARFCRGEAAEGELLGVLQQMPGLEAWQELARALADGVAAEELWRKASSMEGPVSRNLRRAALNSGLAHWSDSEMLEKLPAWGRELTASSDEPLKQFAGRRLLQLHLQHPEAGKNLLSTAETLLGSSELPALVRNVLAPANAQFSPQLEQFLSTNAAAPAALSVSAFEAAHRGEFMSLMGLLEPSPIWQRLPAPPVFLCLALGTVPASERWLETLSRWLHQWPAGNPALEALAIRAGLTPPRPDSAEPPPGTDVPAWLLHQASNSLGRGDPLAALAWVRRASTSGLETLDELRRHAVESALPDLECLGRAALLAQAIRFDPQHTLTPAAVLIGFSDLLQAFPGGPDVFAAASSGNFAQARGRLATVSEHAELTPPLAHHLALVYLRAARQFELAERDDLAAPCWKRCWRCWLAWAAASSEADHPALVFDHLLAGHRIRLKELLARNLVNRARPLWDQLQALPAGASPAGILLKERLSRFRDELAADFLFETRDVMRHGAIPEGWRSDYEQGLSRLRRLLSLDKDNRRLVTALVEICADWFLDLYDMGDGKRLKEEVDRYTPFALQLARSIGKQGETWPEEMTVRTALAEFYKFRAYVTDDLEQKRNLYRDALAFNPANDNVRGLLGSLEEEK